MASSSQGLESGVLKAGCGLGTGEAWQTALEDALDGALAPLGGEAPHLLVVFASAAYRFEYPALLAQASERSGAEEIVGCSASGVIAGERELELEAGIAALAIRLPFGSLLRVRQVGDASLANLGLAAEACTGLIVLADPFTSDVGTLIAGLEREYPGVPIAGGLATGSPSERGTFLFHGRDVIARGAVVIGLGGAARLRPVVSQGCEPIGLTWTITEAESHVVKTIGGRSAYEVLVETIRGLEPELRERVNGNLLVGLAMDEYRDEFRRGDFLIRNLMGVDPKSGAIAIAAEARVGQTLQFQIRDARAADEELRTMLGAESDSAPAAAAILFACNGRGMGLFGAADHDARTVREVLGPLPLAGLFCNGEIGRVGSSTYVHGFTASLALIAATD